MTTTHTTPRSSATAPTPRPGTGSERGAVLVELSLVATVLIVLVLGTFEIGAAWSDHQQVTQASRAGARVGSQVGLDGAADLETLLAIEAGLGDLRDEVSRVVVFEAAADGSMPSGCETATGGYAGGARCNVYDATSFANLTTAGWWGSGGACGSADGNWCSATARDATQTTATYLGVRVEIQRSYLTGMFGFGSHTLSETTVMRIEPES